MTLGIYIKYVKKNMNNTYMALAKIMEEEA